MQKEQKVSFFLFLILLIIFSCDINNYPSIQEIDYVVNYYFEPNSFNYSMDFDFAIKVLLSKKITKIIIENRNTKEFIKIEENNLYFSSVLGKDVFYYKGLRFNFFKNTFSSFIADIRLFDTGMREYFKSFVVKTDLENQDLIKIHKKIYQDKDIDALKKAWNIDFALLEVLNKTTSLKEIKDLRDIKLKNEAENYLYLYFFEKNANLIFNL